MSEPTALRIGRERQALMKNTAGTLRRLPNRSGLRSHTTSTSPRSQQDPRWLGILVLPELLEVAVRSGEREVAVSALCQLTKRAGASRSELALGLLARSRALLAHDDDAERLYRQAIEHLQRCHGISALAHAHLLYGEWLRRQGRWRDACDQLRTAHVMLDSMDAGACAERERAKLAATGEHERKRTVGTRSNELTPLEARIAWLASEGATNAEIAARLCVGPSTVAYRLRRVFLKLGISSRTQLAQGPLGSAPRKEHAKDPNALGRGVLTVV